jgi:tetratricopeptide (TPR) repeat protein
MHTLMVTPCNFLKKKPFPLVCLLFITMTGCPRSPPASSVGSATPQQIVKRARAADWDGRVDEADALYRAYLERTVEQPVEGDHQIVLQSVAMFFEERDPEQAVALYTILITSAETRGDPSAIGYRELLADLHCALGDTASAKAAYRETIERQQALVGDIHPEIANSHRDLGRCLIQAGEIERAFAEFDAMLKIRGALHGETTALLPALTEVARAMATHGSAADALPLYDRALALFHGRYEGHVHQEIEALRAELQAERDALEN